MAMDYLLQDAEPYLKASICVFDQSSTKQAFRILSECPLIAPPLMIDMYLHCV